VPALIVVGDVMVDVGVDAGTLAPGGDVHGQVLIRPGGAGANAAVWAASTGAEVVLYGCVGDDLPGRLLARGLADRGVDARLRIATGARTGAMLVIREEGERSMVADRGANTLLTPQDLPGSLEAGAVLVSGYLLFEPSSEPAALAALERARSNWVAVDAASWPLVAAYGSERFLAATKLATLILANDLEAEALTGMRSEAAARMLASSHPAACVKLGRAGAIWAEGDVVIRAAAEAADAGDPTGAGDAFDGVLLARLAAGAPREDALRDACMAGARAAASPQPWPEGANP
jgi:ribokinase